MSEVYVYQTVHTLAGVPLFPEAHAAALDAASRALFGRPFQTPPRQLAERIGSLAKAEKAPDDLSAFVRMELSAEGVLTLRYGGLSLYRGYELRSLTPEAMTFVYDLPFGEYPTSAGEALGDLARAQAARHGARCAVRCGTDGAVRTADEAPLFAVAGRTVFTCPATESVERSAAAACIEAAGLQLTEIPFSREELPQFDELFSFDHRGVTSLSKCDGRPYMSLAAERVAREAKHLSLKILEK